MDKNNDNNIKREKKKEIRPFSYPLQYLNQVLDMGCHLLIYFYFLMTGRFCI